MAAIAPDRAQLGYALHENEGEAFWLLGMLQTIKINNISQRETEIEKGKKKKRV